MVVEPKEKKKIKRIETVEFKLEGKTYIIRFDKPPKIGEVAVPKGKKKKEIDKNFIDMVKDYGVKVYAVDKAGKETLVKDPSPKLLAQAGKALLKKSTVYYAVLSKA